MIDLETPVPTEPRPKRPMRVVVAGVLAAAAAVVAIAFVVTRDGGRRRTVPDVVTVPPAPPPGAVRHTRRGVRARDVLRRRGRGNTDAADLRHRSATGGRTPTDGWGIGKDDVGFMTFNRPDACSWTPATRARAITRGR